MYYFFIWIKNTKDYKSLVFIPIIDLGFSFKYPIIEITNSNDIRLYDKALHDIISLEFYSFNIDETKQIKLLIHEKGMIGREEVLLFISDNNDEYCRTLLFRINFRENN